MVQFDGGGGSIILSRGRSASDTALRYVESIRWLAPTLWRRVDLACSGGERHQPGLSERPRRLGHRGSPTVHALRPTVPARAASRKGPRQRLWLHAELSPGSDGHVHIRDRAPAGRAGCLPNRTAPSLSGQRSRPRTALRRSRRWCRSVLLPCHRTLPETSPSRRCCGGCSVSHPSCDGHQPRRSPRSARHVAAIEFTIDGG